MASARETLKVEDAVNHGLNILGKGDLVLKDKQWGIIRYITLEKRDIMAVLTTGCGKSLYTSYHGFHGKKSQHYGWYFRLLML